MRVKEFSESDLLVTCFTPDKGRIKGIAKGAKRSRIRFINCLDIFSLINLEYTRGKGGDLYFLQSGKLIEAYPGLRSSYSALARASYMIELTEMLFSWELPDPVMFDILKRFFKLLAQNSLPDMSTELFEIMAMAQGGYSINLDRCCICGRRYEGKGPAVFKPDTGGIACMRCLQATPSTPRMSPDTVKLFQCMQAHMFDSLDEAQTKGECLPEMKTVLKLHREYRLERSPRSLNCL